MKWTPCAEPMVGDTIRWQEPIWAAPTKPRGKPDQIGEQRVTAEIRGIGEFVELKVVAIEKLSLNPGIPDQPLKVQEGEIIRRKEASIERGNCHRWQ